MAEYGRGIKAGIVAGIIYAIIIGVIVLVMADAIMPGFWATMTAGGAGVTATVMGIYAVSFFIAGIIVGAIFGAVYAAAYNSLPGSSIGKGIIIAIIAWIIFGLLLNYGSVATYPAYAVITLIGYIIWGSLTGVFWDKFGK